MSILTRNRGAMLLLMLNIFLAFMGIGLVVPVLPKFISELGMNGSSMGLMVAAFALTQLYYHLCQESCLTVMDVKS